MDEASTLNRRLLEAMDRFGAETCFRIWRTDRYRDVSYRHFRRQTLRLTHALLEHRLRGERVVVWAANSPDWMIVYMAALFAGALVVPLRRSLPAEAILHTLEDCTPRVIVVQDGDQATWVEQQREHLPHLDLLLTIDDPPTDGKAIPEPPGERLSSLVAERLEAEADTAVRETIASAEPAAAAAIHYTTTQAGAPLGAVFDQGQRAATLRHLDAWFHLDDDDVAFTTLPWGYIPSLEAALHYFVSGVPNVLSQRRELVFEEIQQASPTLVLTIPNALERAYDEVIDKGIRTLPESTQEMFYWALTTAKKLLAAGTDASAELRERYARADRTFFSTIRGAFGGRFRRFVCTGAPLDRDLAESIQAIGLVPINVYSVTESGGFPAVHPGDGRDPETCGP
ncbi:MAG: AMP-binding protein, partial [Acidobacteriota bacterium]